MKHNYHTKKVLISGGGTGGHLFPALAIADTIKAKNSKAEILFVGAMGKMEMKRVPERGYKIIGLHISGLERKISLRNVLWPLKVLHSVVKAYVVIKNFKPDVVIGTGGYVSGPVLFVAALCKIPTIIQEQNSICGLTNKILSRFVKNICVAYPGMEDYFPKHKIIYTGNPVRKEILNLKKMDKASALEKLKLDPSKKAILCLGGSLGAQTLNNAMMKNLQELRQHNVQLIWQCGYKYYKYGLNRLKKFGYDHVKLFPFIKSMDAAYAAASLIISRAGATTLSELAIIAKPIIIVPSPHVTNNHQTANALALVKYQAAIYVNNTQVERDLISKAIKLLNDEKEQKKLSNNLTKLAKIDSANIIAKLALSY